MEKTNTDLYIYIHTYITYFLKKLFFILITLNTNFFFVV